jgi:tetratricopeptide (TPR) repeat protein
MTDTAFKAAIAAGIAAHRNRDIAEALRQYEAALALKGEDAEALSLYGAALVQAGRAAEGEGPLLRAVEMAPEMPGLRLNLAEFYRATGQIEHAAEQLKLVVERQPQNTRAFAMLGEALIALGDFEAAADALDSALQNDSGNLPLAVRLARAHAQAGHYPAAFYALEHADKLELDAPDTLQARLDISRANRDWNGVARYAEQLLGKGVETAAVWRDLAIAHFERGLTRAAMQAFEKVLDLEGRTAANLAAYASVALQAGHPDKAGAALDEAETFGADAALKSAQGLRYLQQGDLERALACCEEATAIDPGYIPVYPQLSALRKGALKDPEIAALSGIVDDASILPTRRSMASFVLGHHYDAKGEVDAAFAEYSRANELARQHRRLERVEYTPAEAVRRAEEICELFSNPEDFARLAEPAEKMPATPIFIMGAPRSGTTLLESVVGAHSRVRIGGELPAISTLLQLYGGRGRFAGPLTLEERERYVGAYWTQAPELGGAAYLTDKGLLNLEAAGLVAQMFPASPIIRVRRNPVETGLSIFTHEFTKFWAFTDDLALIAHFLAQNERMAAHWSAVLGDRFKTVQYEDVVADFDAGARRVVAACGLDWEDACAARSGDGAPAATISAVQIREPVVLSGRAKAYERHLGPLIEALEAEGIDLETGALKQS